MIVSTKNCTVSYWYLSGKKLLGWYALSTIHLWALGSTSSTSDWLTSFSVASISTLFLLVACRWDMVKVPALLGLYVRTMEVANYFIIFSPSLVSSHDSLSVSWFNGPLCVQARMLARSEGSVLQLSSSICFLLGLSYKFQQPVNFTATASKWSFQMAYSHLCFQEFQELWFKMYWFLAVLAHLRNVFVWKVWVLGKWWGSFKGVTSLLYFDTAFICCVILSYGVAGILIYSTKFTRYLEESLVWRSLLQPWHHSLLF